MPEPLPHGWVKNPVAFDTKLITSFISDTLNYPAGIVNPAECWKNSNGRQCGNYGRPEKQRRNYRYCFGIINLHFVKNVREEPQRISVINFFFWKIKFI